MNRFSEDPFLCNDCQKLGYCRVKAMQAEVDRFIMRQKGSLESPILSADPEPMPTFKEFVAVHRPDLSKHLPRPAEAEPGFTSGKRPSLAELRAKIAARKLAARTEAQAQEQALPMEQEDVNKQEHAPMALSMPATVATPAPAPVELPKRGKGRPRYTTPRLRTYLVRLGEKPAKHQHYTPMQVSSTPRTEKKTLFPGQKTDPFANRKYPSCLTVVKPHFPVKYF